MSNHIPPTSPASTLPADAETPTRKMLEIAAETGQPSAAKTGQPPGRRLLSDLEVAAMLGCSPRHFRRLVDGGLAPAGLRLGRLRKWDLEVITAWVNGGCKRVRSAGR